MYQSGKLKEERRLELEKIGLKWAVLSTTSWQAMYDALLEYVEMRKKNDQNNQWDGHIPASYETDEKPPKRLGKWITRQRAAFTAKKLKDEYREKLEKLGLSWEPNDNKGVSHSNVAQGFQKQQEKKINHVPVAVQKRPVLPTVAMHQHAKANLSVPPKVLSNDVPLVATLKSPTPLAATSSLKTTTPLLSTSVIKASAATPLVVTSGVKAPTATPLVVPATSKAAAATSAVKAPTATPLVVTSKVKSATPLVVPANSKASVSTVKALTATPLVVTASAKVTNATPLPTTSVSKTPATPLVVTGVAKASTSTPLVVTSVTKVSSAPGGNNQSEK